ncbi:MAG: hypothetical protein JXP36_06145 [Bacteroidales bacterium]|nr:hypothetical protein [Bacteroidales bacterium]
MIEEFFRKTQVFHFLCLGVPWDLGSAATFQDMKFSSFNSLRKSNFLSL